MMRNRGRMTMRVKPPTAAVATSNTWPWAVARSDACERKEQGVGGGGGVRILKEDGLEEHISPKEHELALDYQNI